MIVFIRILICTWSDFSVANIIIIISSFLFILTAMKMKFPVPIVNLFFKQSPYVFYPPSIIIFIYQWLITYIFYHPIIIAIVIIEVEIVLDQM